MVNGMCACQQKKDTKKPRGRFVSKIFFPVERSLCGKYFYHEINSRLLFTARSLDLTSNVICGELEQLFFSPTATTNTM
jgi:hypothetical protein